MLTSMPFGAFDPAQPCNIPGVFASIIFAEPVVINAPIAVVWDIITDFERYPQWNPINRFFKLDGLAKPGQTVTFGPSWGPYDAPAQQLPKHDFITRETITVWEKERCIAYADIRRYMCAERVQNLSAVNATQTCYHTYERTSGILSPFMRLLYSKKIYRGFTANAQALKKRAEIIAVNSQHASKPFVLCSDKGY